jgi:hypothetical protein
MFESIEQYFTLKHSKLHIPLAYIIREQVTLPPATDNPTGNYAMPVAEMIARTPHERNGKLDPVFIVNSGMVLDNITDMFCDTLSWTYMKDFVLPRDGHCAYQALFKQPLPRSELCEQPVCCLREGSCHDQSQWGGTSLEF